MAKRKSAASANDKNEQPKHHSSKRQKSTTTTTTEAPPAVSIKTEEPGLVAEHKSVNSKQNIHNTIYDDMVIIKVGPASTKFTVHRGVLSKSSSFFKDILKSGNVDLPNDVQTTLEGDFTVVLLPQEDPTVFSRVNWWLYNKAFRNPDETWKDIDWQHLLDVYIFSVNKGIAMLHNTCTDAAICKVKHGALFPGQDTINALWNSGDNSAQLRKLFLVLFSTQWDLEKAILANTSYNQWFLNQLVVVLHKTRTEECKTTISAIWKTKTEYWIYGPDNPITVD